MVGDGEHRVSGALGGGLPWTRLRKPAARVAQENTFGAVFEVDD